MSAPIPKLLEHVLDDGNADKSLTTENYARLAQVNADFGEELADRLCELDADQACALFDLARAGLATNADAALLAELRTHAYNGTAIVLLEDAANSDGLSVCESDHAAKLLRLLRGEPSERLVKFACSNLADDIERGEHVKTAAGEVDGE